MTPKSNRFFTRESHFLSHFSRQEATFGVTFGLLWGRPEKSLFRNFRLTFNSSGPALVAGTRGRKTWVFFSRGLTFVGC